MCNSKKNYKSVGPDVLGPKRFINRRTEWVEQAAPTNADGLYSELVIS